MIDKTTELTLHRLAWHRPDVPISTLWVIDSADEEELEPTSEEIGATPDVEIYPDGIFSNDFDIYAPDVIRDVISVINMKFRETLKKFNIKDGPDDIEEIIQAELPAFLIDASSHQRNVALGRIRINQLFIVLRQGSLKDEEKLQKIFIELDDLGVSEEKIVHEIALCIRLASQSNENIFYWWNLVHSLEISDEQRERLVSMFPKTNKKKGLFEKIIGLFR